jgi:integrase
MASVGLVDPFEAHRHIPLKQHLDDFEAALRAKGGTEEQARQVARRARAIVKGCSFVFIGDLSASRVQVWLATLRDAGRDLPPLPPSVDLFTLKQTAAALGCGPAAVRKLVSRHNLAAQGSGKARRFPRATVEALQQHFRRGRSMETSNRYLQAIKQFCRWMLRDGRMAENPLAYLEAGNVKVDRRHDRRELDADELRRLLGAARSSPSTYLGLSGEDRFHLYATACGTGFRAAALASLTPESFDLDGNHPTATLAARRNKSRCLRVQPLPTDVAALLREYIASKPAGCPLWPGRWARDRKGAELLRHDLDAAGIPYRIEGPDGPVFADFHALRHTYLTLGGRAGIDLRTLQELAGHSTPTLTARYSHRRLYDLAGAVERLPSFLPTDPATPQTLPDTGTDPT